MSALRSLIEEATASDLRGMSDNDLTEEAIEISRAIDILTHRLAGIADEARGRNCFRRAGYLNITRWLADITDVDDSTARSLVALASTLARNLDTSRLASAGDLSRIRTRVLSRAARSHPDHYERDEAMLLEFAASLTLSDLKKAVVYWSNCADAEVAESAAAQQSDAPHSMHPRPLEG